MREEFLHYIWKYSLFRSDSLKTVAGKNIKIKSPGIPNQHSGPDFFNAQIELDGTIWVGNVEIHIKSSDWYTHNHHKDPAYNNVILHVVNEFDKKTTSADEKEIPAMILEYNPRLLKNYNKLLESDKWIACADAINKIDPFIIQHTLSNLLVERLEEKSEYIQQLLSQNKGNREETLYKILARNFGFKTNSQPFEQLATRVPLQALAKHKNNLKQIEALLFGAAGMLNDTIEDDAYYVQLKKEFHFLRQKFNIKTLEKHIWKFGRMRPVNFPTIRIAQFAALIHQSTGLFSKITEADSVQQIRELFTVTPSNYWTTHYVFGKKSKEKIKPLGESAFETIMINTIVPILFVYGKQTDNSGIKDKSIQYLEELKPEKNTIIEHWKQLKIDTPNAFTTQALLHLKNNYCTQKKCLECTIGNKLITKEKLSSEQKQV